MRIKILRHVTTSDYRYREGNLYRHQWVLGPGDVIEVADLTGTEAVAAGAAEPTTDPVTVDDRRAILAEARGSRRERRYVFP